MQDKGIITMKQEGQPVRFKKLCDSRVKVQ
jgi:hypothetical protein